ncbi:MAG: hypothetical protein E7678_06925 [Ruminococcaceae bacterium]|nr:hypothetical protein [Oscillospiraceae bacterium]
MKKLLSVFLLIAMFFCFSSCQHNKKDKYIQDVIDEIENEINEIEGTKKQTEKQTEKQTQKPTEPPTRIICFETNGGSKINPIDLNEYEGQMPTTTKADHDFLGWYKDKELTQAVTYPYRPNGITTVYAKWIKIKDTKTGKNCSLKDWNGYNSQDVKRINPSNLNVDELAQNGYKISVSISYDVKYTKDYDILIGYAGAPKYTVQVYDNEDSVDIEQAEVKANSYNTTKNISFVIPADKLKGNTVYLVFSTKNMQNIVKFSNINITYECYK